MTASRKCNGGRELTASLPRTSLGRTLQLHWLMQLAVPYCHSEAMLQFPPPSHHGRAVRLARRHDIIGREVHDRASPSHALSAANQIAAFDGTWDAQPWRIDQKGRRLMMGVAFGIAERRLSMADNPHDAPAGRLQVGGVFICAALQYCGSGKGNRSSTRSSGFPREGWRREIASSISSLRHVPSPPVGG